MYSHLLNTWGGSNKRGGRTICPKLINGEGRIILNNRGGWKFLWFLINREGDFIPNKRGDPKTYLIKGEGGQLTLFTSLSNLIALPTYHYKLHFIFMSTYLVVMLLSLLYGKCKS